MIIINNANSNRISNVNPPRYQIIPDNAILLLFKKQIGYYTLMLIELTSTYPITSNQNTVIIIKTINTKSDAMK